MMVLAIYRIIALLNSLMINHFFIDYWILADFKKKIIFSLINIDCVKKWP